MAHTAVLQNQTQTTRFFRKQIIVQHQRRLL